VNEVAALNDTRGGFFVSHEDAQKSGFPAAVGAHDAEALAALERKAQVAKKRTVVGFGELVHLQDHIPGASDLAEVHARDFDHCRLLDALEAVKGLLPRGRLLV